MNIGDKVYWVYSNTNYGKYIPCPMCFGKKVITVILGDDSQVKSECGFCQHGMDRPSGLAKAWEPLTEVRSGTITGISNRDGLRYEIDREILYAHETYPTQEIAELVKVEKEKETNERAAQWFKDNFITCTKKQIWSVGYHRNCIKDAERKIEWHKDRITMIKEKVVNERDLI